MFKCLHKGCSNTKPSALGYCRKHYDQFRVHGKTFNNTRMDFNIIDEKKTYYELVLTNKSLKEIARVKIDKEDLNKVKSVGRWSLDSEGYAYNSNTDIRMHRLIMNAKEGEEIDHVKVGKKYRTDNRKKNLRFCTKHQNQYNVLKRTTNSSGYKGVSKVRNTNKWQARISIKGKTYFLGVFSTPEAASVAYNKIAYKSHGEFYNKV